MALPAGKSGRYLPAYPPTLSQPGGWRPRFTIAAIRGATHLGPARLAASAPAAGSCEAVVCSFACSTFGKPWTQKYLDPLRAADTEIERRRGRKADPLNCSGRGG